MTIGTAAAVGPHGTQHDPVGTHRRRKANSSCVSAMPQNEPGTIVGNFSSRRKLNVGKIGIFQGTFHRNK